MCNSFDMLAEFIHENSASAYVSLNITEQYIF